MGLEKGAPMASRESSKLSRALLEKGVVVHAPGSTVFEDIVPAQIEAGVEIFPGCVVRGARTWIGAGSKLGHSGGGLYEDVTVGRGVELYGGVFKDAVFLDGVTVRGNAEMRGGTLMEEGCEVAHHVGFKMTITMPNVVVGSLVNFCDALVAGGTGRKDHTEVGSCLALYNFTPWGDKFASLFGDVPSGVFLRSRRIFVGGQTQIVSPVKVGYGALIPAGCAVRRSVPAGRMVGASTLDVDTVFDQDLYGGLTPKFSLTREYVGNLRALLSWYRSVRVAFAGDDLLGMACCRAAVRQIEAGIAERVKRLDKIVARLPRSLEKHRSLVSAGQDAQLHGRRAAEHEAVIDAWPGWRGKMLKTSPDLAGLLGAREQMVEAAGLGRGYVEAVRGLSEGAVEAGVDALSMVVSDTVEG